MFPYSIASELVWSEKLIQICSDISLLQLNKCEDKAFNIINIIRSKWYINALELMIAI